MNSDRPDNEDKHDSDLPESDVSSEETIVSPTDGAPPPSESIPDRLKYFGDYQLDSEIARGGMGIVYRGRQVSLDRAVAIKMLLAGEYASESDIRRFQTEAQAAAELDHPHIVPIYEIGEHEGLRYFSMKLIEGKNLSQHARQAPGTKAELQNYVKLLVQICNAVGHAHERGILHRDLKPSNILIDEEGNAHVTDFGVAKRTRRADELTQTGAVIGTPGYLSPEQAAGESKRITVRSDIYGLGAILYRLLTGQAPFKADNLVETLRKVQESDLETPRALNLIVDRDLEAICLKCMHKDTERRYETADELANDLSKWLAGEPLSVRPMSGAEMVWQWVKKNVKQTTLVVLVTLVFGILGSLSVFGTMYKNMFSNAQITYETAQKSPPYPYTFYSAWFLFETFGQFGKLAILKIVLGIGGLWSIALINSLVVKPSNAIQKLRLCLFSGFLLGLVFFLMSSPAAILRTIIIRQLSDQADVYELAEGSYLRDINDTHALSDEAEDEDISMPVQQDEEIASDFHSISESLRNEGEVNLGKYPRVIKDVVRRRQEIEFERRFEDMSHLKRGSRGSVRFASVVADQASGAFAAIYITFPFAILSGLITLTSQSVIARSAIKQSTQTRTTCIRYYEYTAILFAIVSVGVYILYKILDYYDYDDVLTPESLLLLGAAVVGHGIIYLYDRMIDEIPPALRLFIFFCMICLSIATLKEGYDENWFVWPTLILVVLVVISFSWFLVMRIRAAIKMKHE